MRITRIRLSDFKRHAELEIEPAAGLTIIRGPNEAGKSTVQQALELVLFRKADANRDDIRSAHAWGSTSAPQVELDFDVEGSAGTLLKRFDGARSEAELTFGGESTRDYARIQERVAELTGIPTEAFFRATASVGHAELGHVGGDEPLIQDRLQEAISGADRGTAKAKKKLDAAIHRYRTEGHKNPGRLKIVREEIGLLEGELAAGEAALQSLEADRAQWVEAVERRDALEVQLGHHQADLDEALRAESLARQRDDAQERWERLKRAAELELEAERLQASIPTALPLAQLRTDVARATSLEYEASELEANLDAEALLRDEDDEVEPPPRPAGWLALGAGLVLLAAAVWLVLSGAVALVLGVLVLAGAAIALAQAARVATRRRQYGLARQMADRAARELHDADRGRQEQARRDRRDLETTLARIGVEDIATATELLATTEACTDRLSQIEGELRGLGLSEHNVRRLEEARDQAANEAERAAHALTAMGQLGEDPTAVRRAAQRALDQVIPKRDTARSEADQAMGRVGANPVDAEVVAGLAERLAIARERQAEMERRMAVYQGTLAAIESAEQATLKTAARFLEERMGPSISTITDGRYEEIEVDEKNLAFTVRAPETGELVDAAQLSQGTADQLYLTARLGLVRLVTMDRRPPLILDDPFVTFDRSRGERALRLVKRIAAEQGFQVLYLTCSSRFDQLADKLVLLEGPSSDRVLSVPVRHQPPPRDLAEQQPLLHFEPDPRPNPDPVAPRQSAPETTSAKPQPESGRFDDHDSGVVDPFRLDDRDPDRAAD